MSFYEIYMEQVRDLLVGCGAGGGGGGGTTTEQWNSLRRGTSGLRTPTFQKFF